MKQFSSGWYLLYLRPNFERKVSDDFNEIKITHFLPTSMIVREWKDRKRMVESPLFPSYIFVQLNDHYQYVKVFESKGVMHYVKCGKDVVKISETTIASLKSVLNTSNQVEVSSGRFKLGQQVLINSGAFTGFTCEVVKHNGNSKVLIRLDILNRNVLVDLPNKILQLVN